MGRRKQKVRWASVEEAFFEGQVTDDNDVSVVTMVVDAPQTDVDFDSDDNLNTIVKAPDTARIPIVTSPATLDDKCFTPDRLAHATGLGRTGNNE